MTSSQDYTYLTITAGSQEIHAASQRVDSLIKYIIQDLQDIMNALSDLNLSWVGQSQQEANKFNKEWQTAIATLFGTKKNPQQGVLTQLSMALATAAANYAAVEESAENACNQFVSAILFPSGNPPSASAPPSVVNPPGEIITAITETF